MGLGSLLTISLAEARKRAENCRKLLLDGIDPLEERKARLAQRKIENAKTKTFRSCAEAFIKAHSASWSNIKHSSQWSNTLKTYVYPVFGDLPVQAVDTGLVMEVLEPIWTVKTETASRVRARIEAILDWARTHEYRKGENPARWKGHLKNLLPDRAKIQKVKHHAALPFVEVGSFMAVLRQKESISSRGLEFLILTAARTGEVIGAQWDEINFGSKVWTISAERMKSDREHRVPLSPSALSVLSKMKTVSQNDFVFPGQRTGRPLSNMAFLQLLKRMNHSSITAHGFRSTFRDWAAERTGYPNEVAEMALAHAVGNKVEAAYRRGDLFEKRRKIMDDWAIFCASNVGAEGNVVGIRQV